MKKNKAVYDILKNYKNTNTNYTVKNKKTPKKSGKFNFLKTLFKKNAKKYYKGKMPKSTMIGVRG